MMWGNADKYAQVRVPLPIKDSIESEAEAEEDEEESEDVTVADMMAITRRSPNFGNIVQTHNNIHFGGLAPVVPPRDVEALQKLWYEHAKQAADLYPVGLWCVLHAVKLETKTV